MRRTTAAIELERGLQSDLLVHVLRLDSLAELFFGSVQASDVGSVMLRAVSVELRSRRALEWCSCSVSSAVDRKTAHLHDLTADSRGERSVVVLHIRQRVLGAYDQCRRASALANGTSCSASGDHL